MTGDGVVAFSPFVYAPTLSPLSLYSDMVVSYEITANIDLFVNFATIGFAPAFGYSGSWIIPRIDLGANNIIAVQIGANPTNFGSTFYVAPQYHFFWENDSFAIEANLIAKFVAASIANPSFTFYAAPSLKFAGGIVDVYCEVVPAYTVGGAFSFTVVPGLYFNMEAGGQLSLGVGLGDLTTGTINPGVFLSYIYTIATKK